MNAAKTKVVRPTRSKYLGFTFLRNGGEWKVKSTTEKKKKLKKKRSEYLKRGRAIARPLVVTIKRVNEIVRGWINYCNCSEPTSKMLCISSVWRIRQIKFQKQS